MLQVNTKMSANSSQFKRPQRHREVDVFQRAVQFEGLFRSLHQHGLAERIVVVAQPFPGVENQAGLGAPGKRLGDDDAPAFQHVEAGLGVQGSSLCATASVRPEWPNNSFGGSWNI